MPSVTPDLYIKFDLTETPKLAFTDNTDYTGVDLTTVAGVLEVRHPDDVWEKNTDYTNPDIYAESGVLVEHEENLRLAADDNQPQNGAYRFIYRVYIDGVESGSLMRDYDFNYSPISLSIGTNFDVFTPSLSCSDTTPTYNKGGFSLTMSRLLKAETQTLGLSKTTSGRVLDIVFDGAYYDAEYLLSLTVAVSYQSSTYDWVSIDDSLTTTEETTADTPPIMSVLNENLTTYRNTLDSYLGVNNTLYEYHLNGYRKAQNTYSHICFRIGMEQIDETLYNYVESILDIFRNYQPKHYTNLNTAIYPYDPGTCGGNGTDGFTGEGVPRFEAMIIGDDVTTEFDIDHNFATDYSLNYNAPQVEITRNTNPIKRVYTKVERDSGDKVKVHFKIAPAQGESFYVSIT